MDLSADFQLVSGGAGTADEQAEEILSGDEIKTASFQREELLELLEERF